MKYAKIINIILIFTIVLIFKVSAEEDSCKTYLINAARLNELHREFINNKIQSNPAFKTLIAEAEGYLNMKPVSVTEKTKIPPSGNKHDYMSMGPYWWPNPNTKNHLPYIRRDGERNPEIYKIPDHKLEGKLVEAVNTLSLAFYITRNSKFSSKAAQLIRVWFLNKNTRMNPNLNYSQGIPGICSGRGIGIIETHNFSQIVDDIGMLEASKEWTKNDDTGIKKWFEKYLYWLTNSKYGKDEAGWKNNHGSWYDVQTVSISFFLGKNKLAKRILNDSKTKRIGYQIESDGKQPEELARTKSWGYSVFNLTALFKLACLGDNAGINLWTYKNSKGGSIRKALDFILTNTLNMNKWKYKQIEKIDVNSLYPLLKIACNKYGRKKYLYFINKIFKDKQRNSTINLIY